MERIEGVGRGRRGDAVKDAEVKGRQDRERNRRSEEHRGREE